MDRSPGAWLAFVGVERNTLNRDAGALEASATGAVISVISVISVGFGGSSASSSDGTRRDGRLMGEGSFLPS